MSIGKVLFFFMVLMFGVIIYPVKGMAAYDNRVEYITANEITVEGKELLRLEIGLSNNKLSYQLSERYSSENQLLIELKNTTLGNLNREIVLFGDLASKVIFVERENASLDVRVYANHSLQYKNSYSITRIPADKKKKLPYRLVIDIFNPIHVKHSNGLLGKTIILDPGHGGSDSGAIGYTGVLEKDITLSVSKKMATALEAEGARVVMTRYKDNDVYRINSEAVKELQARVDYANNTPNADIFISIHCNAFSNNTANGIETFYYKGVNDFNLSKYLLDELEKASGLKNRGVKQANFYVLKHSNIPASLVELGFLTNPNEENLLNKDEYQHKLALSLVRGIIKYFEGQ